MRMGAAEKKDAKNPAMADAPTYASLTEEINSLKRLRKVHKARSDVAQKARRASGQEARRPGKSTGEMPALPASYTLERDLVYEHLR